MAIPSSVLSEHFQERLSGKQLLGALFLTFEFDPGFFEQEILPVILDAPVSHSQVARLLQLEHALHDIPHGVSVFYDATGLRASDYTAPRLDVRRYPLALSSGVFHPKNVLLLTEDRDAGEDGTKTRRLLVATLSANITRSGWWENVEACQIEELTASATTRLKDPLRTLLSRVARLTANNTAIRALEPYRTFLNGLDQASTKSRSGWLRPHLFVCGGGNGEDLAAFLRDHVERLSDYRLEVISPYFDAAPARSPLAALIKAFQPLETRVFLPRDSSGVAQCSAEFFDYVEKVAGNVSWGLLPDELLGLGKRAEATHRPVHAKVYRLFKPHPKTEYLFVGSVNLTQAGHSGSGGNLETGILVQMDPPSRPEFWLRPLKHRPPEFQAVASEDEEPEERPLPLQVRFSWRTREASARWEAKSSPVLTLCGTSGSLGAPFRSAPKEWLALPRPLCEQLATELLSTSIIEAQTEGGERSKLLVQEEDMPVKPDLIRTLPIRDILQFWSLLKPEQRQAFIDSRAGALTPGELGALVTRLDDGGATGNDIFSRCAGIFHAFAQLERRVAEAIESDHETQAVTLMFGQRFDSLGTLLARVVEPDPVAELDDIEAYLLLMCAQQVVTDTRRRWPQFWAGYPDQAAVLDASLQARAGVRQRLGAGAADLPRFIDWFDKWFLKRVAPLPREEVVRS